MVLDAAAILVLLGHARRSEATTQRTVEVALRFVPLPILSIQLQSANTVQLSWPVQLTNFGLQSKPSLLSGYLWTDVLTAPVISGNERLVVETNLAPAKFYRLKD